MKNRKIRFLSAEDLEKTLSMTEAIRAVKEAFQQLSTGQAIVPLRTPMALADRDGGAFFMPVYLPESEQITLFKSVGNAVQDLAAASRALGRAGQLGLGVEVSL